MALNLAWHAGLRKAKERSGNTRGHQSASLRVHGDIVNIMASMEVLDLLNALDLDAISLDDLKTLRRDGYVAAAA
jgi:hypothetical protein